jgi:hypothetical protein
MKTKIIVKLFVTLLVTAGSISCVKNEKIGHFKVKGYIINAATGNPEDGRSCSIEYLRQSIVGSKPIVQIGSGIVGSDGYFEISCELYRSYGLYQFLPYSIDLVSDYNDGRDLKNGEVYDLDTLYY